MKYEEHGYIDINELQEIENQKIEVLLKIILNN